MDFEDFMAMEEDPSQILFNAQELPWLLIRPPQNMEIDEFIETHENAAASVPPAVEVNINLPINEHDAVIPPDLNQDIPMLANPYDPYKFESDADDEDELQISPSVVREARLKRANAQPNRDGATINTDTFLNSASNGHNMLWNTPQPLQNPILPSMALLPPINYSYISQAPLLSEPTHSVIRSTQRCAPEPNNMIPWQPKNPPMPAKPRGRKARSKTGEKPVVRYRLTAKDFREAKQKIVKSEEINETFYILPTTETTYIDKTKSGVLINALWTSQPQCASMFGNPLPGTGFYQPMMGTPEYGQTPASDMTIKHFYVEVKVPKDLKISHIVMVENKNKTPCNQKFGNKHHQDN